MMEYVSLFHNKKMTVFQLMTMVITVLNNNVIKTIG